MVITVTVANKSGRNEDGYFLSQGRTIKSANNNIYKHLCGIYDYFDYQSGQKDIMDLLLSKFARWQDGKDTWDDEDSWSNRFPDFTFPRCNQAGIIEISKEMFDAISEEANWL